MKERIAQIQKTLPEGVVIEPFIDRSELVGRAMGTVEKNLLEGGQTRQTGGGGGKRSFGGWHLPGQGDHPEQDVSRSRLFSHAGRRPVRA